uniref:Uncharacterized protein n=1 Tax=Podarcis muralis TaxID=64176 RepID=A0A670ID72_PODMU
MAGTAIRLRQFVDTSPQMPPGYILHQGKDVVGYYPGQTARVHYEYPPESERRYEMYFEQLAIESNPLPSRKHHQSTPDIWLSSLCLKTSKEGDSTTLLGSKFQCRTALTVRKFFLMFRWNLLSCSLDPLLRVRFSGAAENNLSPSSI